MVVQSSFWPFIVKQKEVEQMGLTPVALSIWLPSAGQVSAFVTTILPGPCQFLTIICSRIILTIGFLVFSLAVLYVVSRRIGLLTLQRKLADAIRSGSVSAGNILAKVQEGPAPTNAPYDEL